MGAVPWTVYAPTRRKQGRQLPPGKDWKTAEQKVLRLQMRIAKAAKQKKYRLMRSLQWLPAHSFYAKLPAVRRVTSNKGKNTPGVDEVVWKTSRQKMEAVKCLRRRGYRALPLRRVYILIKPTHRSVQGLQAEARRILKAQCVTDNYSMIRRLNQLIRGWCNYHRHAVSSRIFSKFDSWLHFEIRRWLHRRHPNKGRRWIKKK